jgi:hypothetical protein
MNGDEQAVIKPARVGVIAAVAATFVVSYLVVISHLVMRGGGHSPLEPLGTVLDRFLKGNHNSSADTKLKADTPANNPKSARGGGIKRARAGQFREGLRTPAPLPESNRGTDVTVRDVGGGPTAAAAAPAFSVAPLRRTISYLPGQRSEWTAYNLDVDTPRIIRAAGQISIGKDVSDPNGFRDSKDETGLRRKSDPRWKKRALPSAPYLALIGRVCSDRTCSQPFFVGASAVVCPSGTVGGRVQLQLRTNRYDVVDGMATLGRSAHVFGGFSIYAEAAPDDACGDRSGILPIGHDVTPMASGEVLRGPDLRVPGNQIWWKPFFIPLSQPLLIRASGKVQPRGGATATGPNGIAVSDTPWFYPGAPDVVVDTTKKLYQRALPYQALIGRLCGVTECGPAFLVGDERIVCAKSPHDHHLELWINQIVGPPADTFEVLQRHGGEYRFELSGAPAGACAPAVTMK